MQSTRLSPSFPEISTSNSVGECTFPGLVLSLSRVRVRCCRRILASVFGASIAWSYCNACPSDPPSPPGYRWQIPHTRAAVSILVVISLVLFSERLAEQAGGGSNSDHAVASFSFCYICRRAFSFPGTDNSHRTDGRALFALLAQDICQGRTDDARGGGMCIVHGNETLFPPSETVTSYSSRTCK